MSFMHHSPEAILEAGYRDASTSLFLETRIVPTIFTEDKFLVTANAELNGAALFAASEQGGFLPCVFE